MPLATQVSPDRRSLTINIRGRFDFSLHQDFRKAYEQGNGTTEHYVINLRDTEYLDSSALGMLLLLREHAGGDGSRVTLASCRPEVKKILTIANFHKMFTVE